jgi:hypothetical protein
MLSKLLCEQMVTRQRELFWENHDSLAGVRASLASVRASLASFPRRRESIGLWRLVSGEFSVQYFKVSAIRHAFSTRFATLNLT